MPRGYVTLSTVTLSTEVQPFTSHNQKFNMKISSCMYNVMHNKHVYM